MKNKRDLFRIGQLERVSGVPRRNIHFYINQGLLHQPVRTGRTMAYYDAAHVNKLAYIMEQKSMGKPLFAIRRDIEALEEKNPDHFHKKRQPGRGGIQPPLSAKSRGRGRGGRMRQAILDLGCSMFREKGYRATRVSDITKSLNIGKGTFYFYFSDKKELLLACVPKIFAELFGSGWDAIRKEEDPIKRLMMRAQMVLPVLGEFCAILDICEEAQQDKDPKLKKMGEQTIISIRRPLESDIRKGMALGVIRKVNPAVAASLMIGAMREMHLLRSMDPGISDREILKELTGLILSGMEQRATKR